MNLTISTGCKTLDRLLGGGLLGGSATLIRGGAGTGKTTLGIQFLVEGARIEEKGLYILLEGDPIRILSQFEGLNLGELVKSGKITILDLAQARIGVSRNYISPNIVQCPEADLNHALLHIFEIIEERNITRVVLDSIEAFMTIIMREIIQARDVLFRIIGFCCKEGVTSVFISEKSETTEQRGDPFESHLADGVIVLGREFIGNQAIRTLQILKMRGLAHDSRIHPFRISESGILIISTRDATQVDAECQTPCLGIQELDRFIPISQESLILIETDSESTHWIPLVVSFLQEGVKNKDPILYLVTGKESRKIAEGLFEKMMTSEEFEHGKPAFNLVFIDALANLERQKPLESNWLPKYAQYRIAKDPHDPRSVFDLFLNIKQDIQEQIPVSEAPSLFREFEILSERALELGEDRFLQFLNTYYFQLLSQGFLCLGVLNPEIHSLKFTKAVEFISDVIIRTWIADGRTLVQVVKSPYDQSQLFVFDDYSLNPV